MAGISPHMMPEIEKKDFQKGAQRFTMKQQHALIAIADSLHYSKFKNYCKKLEMELRSRSVRRCGVEGHEGDAPSKRRRTTGEEKGKGSHSRGRSFRRVLAEEEAEMDTSSRSQYMARSSGCSGSSSRSEPCTIVMPLLNGWLCVWFEIYICKLPV